jgi:hypothetical protein
VSQQDGDREAAACDSTIRVDEERHKGHHRRLRRIGAVMTFACVAIGVAAPLLSVYLSIVSMIQAIGLVFAIDMWLRAGRGLRRSGGLNVGFDGPRVTVWHDGAAPLVVAEPVTSAVAYPDFVMLVAGTDYRRLHQVELALEPPARDALLRALSSSRVTVRTARFSRVGEILFALTVVPLLVALGYLAYRAVLLLALGGIVALLHQLPANVGLALFFLFGAAGLVLLLVRLVRRVG